MTLTCFIHIKTLNCYYLKYLKLVKTNNLFKANKLSLNADKIKYAFFQRAKVSDNLLNCVIKIKHSIKFLDVLIDENLTFKSHINNIENKIYLFKA